MPARVFGGRRLLIWVGAAGTYLQRLTPGFGKCRYSPPTPGRRESIAKGMGQNRDTASATNPSDRIFQFRPLGADVAGPTGFEIAPKGLIHIGTEAVGDQ